MQPLGKSFGKPVGQDLQHKAAVIIQRIFIILYPFFNANPGCHGKKPNIINLSR